MEAEDNKDKGKEWSNETGGKVKITKPTLSMPNWCECPELIVHLHDHPTQSPHQPNYK